MDRPERKLEKEQHDRTSYKFNFELGSNIDGYVNVHSAVSYKQELGYGFITATEGEQQEAHHFIVKAKPANYTVTVVAKHSNQAVDGKVGIVIEEIPFVTDHQLSVTQAEVFHIELALINECMHFIFFGSIDHIEKLEIHPLAGADIRPKPTLYLASDSTVANYDKQYRPQAGWGEKLDLWLNTDQINIDNRAIGGLSSKTFLVGGHLNRLLLDIQAGDYLIMQWSHNDSTPIRPARYVTPPQFKGYLNLYIQGARQRGATPILVTPVNRRDFTGTSLNYSFPAYVAAMKEVALETDTLLIDLNELSWTYFQELGVEGTKSLFMWVDGKEDDTHLHENGANVVAQMAARLLAELPSPIASFVDHEKLC